MDADPIDLARRLARDLFPEALAVVLAGSTASGRATPSSDLDVAVLVGDGGETFRETLRAWAGGGKWLPRRLLAADAERGSALLEGHLRLCRSEDPTPLVDAASRILDLVGGPLREGYRRTWRGVVASAAAPVGR
ncbi:nucleotidyltransferase domain-containing protein [Streptomyces sp. NPDC060333]|uniref:nucleotidyltransferase domain-containing protein n=1 Tax=Streptomyces sp. NPDC060333 TaxID=3347098 RepID=UPI0036518AF0